MLDAAAELATQERPSLTLNGYRKVPEVGQDSTRDVWMSAPVEMADMIFSAATLSPDFFDYETYRSEMVAGHHDAWRSSVETCRGAALQYYADGYAPGLKASVIEAVEVLPWIRAFAREVKAR